MKRNQNRVLKHSIPSRTAPQPQTPSPAQERPAVNQAILDYESVVNEAIALIDLFRTTLCTHQSPAPNQSLSI